MNVPTAAMIVIGDEILSGRTKDVNIHHIATQLTEYGIDLKEARIIADDQNEIIETVKLCAKKFDYVFTSGGIGPTHDDITADCIAQAFDVPLAVRDDARKILATNYKNGEADLTPTRLRMARIPHGATLIHNPISKAPGFSIENVHVMAGIPSIFSAMLEGLLPKLAHGTRMLSKTIRVDKAESLISEPLGHIASDFPNLSIGSYPFYENNAHGAHIVIRGRDYDEVIAALNRVKEHVVS